MRTIAALTGLLGLIASSSATDPYVVNNDGGNFTVKKVSLSCSTTHFQQRSIGYVEIDGIVNKELLDGNIQYQVFEQGVTAKTAEGSFAYFKCDNKGCDKTQPMALTLADPNAVPTSFSAKFQFQMPYREKTGQMTLAIYGTDQDHFPYDFAVSISFNYTSSLSLSAAPNGGGNTECKNDVDCPSSYCMNGPSKTPPYFCHDCGDNCCNSDSDCPGSYCMKDPSKKPPYTCHAADFGVKELLAASGFPNGGGDTECKNDVDCPSSYCMNGPSKTPPYFCHDCGDNCCNSDSDCPGSYCMKDPSKKPPYTCH